MSRFPLLQAGKGSVVSGVSSLLHFSSAGNTVNRAPTVYQFLFHLQQGYPQRLQLSQIFVHLPATPLILSLLLEHFPSILLRYSLL